MFIDQYIHTSIHQIHIIVSMINLFTFMLNNIHRSIHQFFIIVSLITLFTPMWNLRMPNKIISWAWIQPVFVVDIMYSLEWTSHRWLGSRNCYRWVRIDTTTGSTDLLPTFSRQNYHRIIQPIHDSTTERHGETIPWYCFDRARSESSQNKRIGTFLGGRSLQQGWDMPYWLLKIHSFAKAGYDSLKHEGVRSI